MHPANVEGRKASGIRRRVPGLQVPQPRQGAVCFSQTWRSPASHSSEGRATSFCRMVLIQLAFFAAQHKDAHPGDGQGDDGNDEFKERHSFTSLRILPKT